MRTPIMRTAITNAALLSGMAIAALCITTVASAQSTDIAVTGNITVKSCSLDTANVVIMMDPASVSDIRAVDLDSAVAASNSGNIVFNCETAGMNISLSMQDANFPASQNPYLSLSGADQAGGVGIQMFRQDGTAIALGLAGSAATWLAGNQVPAGQFTVPIQTRYYRTSSYVTAGSANALALFDVTYN